MVTSTVEVDLLNPATFELASTAEWRSACTGRHNILLEGPRASTDAVLRLLTPHLCGPVASNAFEVDAERPGSLVLQEVEALCGAEQDGLLGWLTDSGGRTQVVSTTTGSLFSLVARGLFDQTLYYRLNVILLQVG